MPFWAAAGAAATSITITVRMSTVRAMSTSNLLRAYGAAARSPHPAWAFAAALVIGEAVLAIFGVRSVALASLALLAPGWALIPLLPAAVRRRPVAALAAAPILGFAAVSIVLITWSVIGLPLSGTWIRLLLLVIVALALGLWAGAPAPRRPRRGEVYEALGLLGALAVGLVLALRVAGSTPLPGNDWAKYLLYADEIRRHGALLIDNPFWMLGVPFREDPAVPAVYGSVLLMARASAGILANGIVVFTVLQIAAVFAFARAFWGRAAGVLAAFLVAVVPATQDMLGWHGLPNVAALALMALALASLATFASGALDRPGMVGAAVVLVGIAATHRLSLIVTLGAAALVIVGRLLVREGRGRAARDAGVVAGLAALLGVGVWVDLVTRQRTFGGTQPYTAYLDTKVDLGLAVRDISPVLAAALGAALVVVAVWRRSDRALWPAIAMLAVSAGLAYVWLLHVPNYYARMVFFVPVAAAPVVAAVVVRMRPVALVAALTVVAVAFTTVQSYDQAPRTRAFYAFANPVSLRGLDALAPILRPDEVVVTDRCWSFLGTWLLHTRTLPALIPQDIQPKAELVRARQARAILDGTPAGRAQARTLAVRYALMDPLCPAADGSLPTPPPGASVVFASPRLAILRLRR